MIRLRSFSLKLRQLGIRNQLISFFLCLLCLPALHAQGRIHRRRSRRRRCPRLRRGAREPSHLYLGTTNSWLYESMDEGATWHRLAKARSRRRIRPRQHRRRFRPSLHALCRRMEETATTAACGSATMPATPWPNRALQGPADPRSRSGAFRSRHILFAGTPAGRLSLQRFRRHLDPDQPARQPRDSRNRIAGRRSPESRHRLRRNLAPALEDHRRRQDMAQHQAGIDRRLRRVLHHRRSRPPHTVYLSACSGIYKSENAGLLFRKIQGIPSEARRTRVLMQDPENREVVYAGTTEGLYKTVNGGQNLSAHDRR